MAGFVLGFDMAWRHLFIGLTTRIVQLERFLPLTQSLSFHLLGRVAFYVRFHFVAPMHTHARRPHPCGSEP